MIHSRLFRSIAALSFAATVPVLAQGGGRTKPPERVEMERLEEAVDKVAEYVKKFEGTAPLAELDTALKSLQEAKKHTPRSTAQQPEDQREAFVLAYRVAINKTIRGLLDLEDAILHKDKEAAQKALTELNAQQKASHRKFKPKRRRRGAGK